MFETEDAANLALNGLKGSTSINIKVLRQKLVDLISHIEVNIDYPEYEDEEQITEDILIPRLNILKKDMEKVAELITIEEDLAVVKDEMDEVSALLDERIDIEKETLDIKAKE